MKTNLLICLVFIFCSNEIFAQYSPFNIQTSEGADVSGHEILATIPLGVNGVIQVDNRRCESFKFFHYSSDLKLKNQNTVTFEKGSEMIESYDPIFLSMKTKSYLLVRQVNREKVMEGISAIEFSADKLAFVGDLRNLYNVDKPGDNLIDRKLYDNLLTTQYRKEIGGHVTYTSSDSSKLLLNYIQKPKVRNDKENFAKVSLQLYDDNLEKIWGGVFKLPHSEYKMDIESYFVANSGKVYMVTRVYTSQTHSMMYNTDFKKFYYELLVFDKTTTAPKRVKIDIDKVEIQTLNFIQNSKGEIYIAGMLYNPYEAPFIAKFDELTDQIQLESFTNYRRSLEILKMYRTVGERNKIDRVEQGIDTRTNKNVPGLERMHRELYEKQLTVRKLFFVPDGTFRMIAEVDYFSGNSDYARANDIYVYALNKDFKLEWVRKIPKCQAQNTDIRYEHEFSINAILTGSTVNLFYLDNPVNFNVDENSVPEYCKEGKTSSIIGIQIDKKGEIKKYNIASTDQLATNFYIRLFLNGGQNNLMNTQRKGKNSFVYSLNVKN